MLYSNLVIFSPPYVILYSVPFPSLPQSACTRHSLISVAAGAPEYKTWGKHKRQVITQNDNINGSGGVPAKVRVGSGVRVRVSYQ